MARSGLSSLSLSLSLSSLNWGPLLAFAELPICDLGAKTRQLASSRSQRGGDFGAKLVRPIGIRIREVSTRKVQHPWGKSGRKRWRGLGPNPARGPCSQSQVGHCVSPPLGDRDGPSRLRRRCVLHLHIPGWAGGGVCGVVDELVVDGVEKK